MLHSANPYVQQLQAEVKATAERTWTDDVACLGMQVPPAACCCFAGFAGPSPSCSCFAGG